MWFDVEEGYNTTFSAARSIYRLLWFDVEEGYNTTMCHLPYGKNVLWFDVEEGYNTTSSDARLQRAGCGLM